MQEPRSDLISDAILLACVAALAFGVLAVLRPFLPAILWATIIVVATWPMMLQRAAFFRRAARPGGCGDEHGAVRGDRGAGGIAARHADHATAGPARCGQPACLRGPGLARRPGWRGCRTARSSRLPGSRPRSARPITGLEAVKPYLSKSIIWLSQHLGTLGGITLDFLLTLVLVVVFYQTARRWRT